MLFNTLQYLMFLPLVVLIYYILPRQICHIWLLIASYYFYMQWNALYVLLMFFSTVVTYIGARFIERFQKKSNNRRSFQKSCLIVCLLLNLGILFFFKYFAFVIDCINSILLLFGLHTMNWKIDILLPVGISFYTLQALGYLIDVYRQEISAEKNFFRYALFVSFFPQLVAGPIERSKNLLCQLKERHFLSYENIQRGFYLILWGLFLKMVIADYAAIVVNNVYADTNLYPGIYIVFATFLFSIQIYCDFYGYSTIARGSAIMMGINLMDNFEAPYYSRNIKEFWRRWHISLSSWFKDYLYIPLGGNRKGKNKKRRNLLVVFCISGLWHGASLGYVLWGGGKWNLSNCC